MKILILHAWLRGNLGDFCITRAVVRALRAGLPQAFLHLVSCPTGAFRPTEIIELVDQFSEQFPGVAPATSWGDADVVVIAPGGGLQKAGDHRARWIYRDAAVALAREQRVVFSGHSFAPAGLRAAVLRRCTVLARETCSQALLRAADVPHVAMADYAWLEPLPPRAAGEDVLVFLRFDHFREVTLDSDRRRLWTDGRPLLVPPGRLVLASSDPLRDGARLATLAQRWVAGYRPMHTLPELLAQLAGAAAVVSDRFHPALWAHRLGVPLQFLPQETARDHGLLPAFSRPLLELQNEARAGLAALTGACGMDSRAALG